MINKPNSKLPGIICEFSFPASLQAEPEQTSQPCLGGIQSGPVSGISQERPRTPCSLSALPPTNLHPGKACNLPWAKLLGPLICKTEQTHTCPLGSLSTKRNIRNEPRPSAAASAFPLGPLQRTGVGTDAPPATLGASTEHVRAELSLARRSHPLPREAHCRGCVSGCFGKTESRLAWEGGRVGVQAPAPPPASRGLRGAVEGASLSLRVLACLPFLPSPPSMDAQKRLGLCPVPREGCPPPEHSVHLPPPTNGTSETLSRLPDPSPSSRVCAPGGLPG
ncbi:unnamed protein product [Rangifer tarandus platyrhynchus]|uniref:Uncharacterized protein n=1 Tax=Rangifer tarandus platyrhynchus TaxID=3082113 RepID=A0AC59YF63_RANTA